MNTQLSSWMVLLALALTLTSNPGWAQSSTTSSESILPSMSRAEGVDSQTISTTSVLSDFTSGVGRLDDLDSLTAGSAAVPFFDRLTSPTGAPTQPARMLVRLPDLEAFEQSLTSARRPIVRVGIQSVIARTVQKNLNIRLRQIQSARASDEVAVQEGIFDLKVFGLLNAIKSEVPTDLRDLNGDDRNPFVNRTTARQIEGGLEQLLFTGGVLSIDMANQRTETNSQSSISSPLEDANASLNLRQPLLRGAGPFVTRAGITISQLGERSSLYDLRAQLLHEISTSMQLYFDLVFAVANVDVLRVSLAQAEELLRVNTAKFNAGVLPELDVLQAQADVASRIQDVIVALQAVELASDRLRLQLAEIGDNRDVSLRPADKATVPSFTIDEKNAISTAMAHRPEMEIAALVIEQINVSVGVAENNVLPQLDAKVGVGLAGSNSDARGAFGDLYDREANSWNAGLAFSYPLQNRSARGRLSQSRRDLEQATVRRQLTRDQILLDVRSAIRDVETNRQKVKVGRATVEFNIAKVDSGQKRQQVGLATSFDVLAFQRDLANARSQLIQSVVDLNKSTIELEAAKGTLLDRVGVDMRRPTQPKPRTTGRKTPSPMRSRSSRTGTSLTR
jgi:outer membrane protein